MFLLGGTCFLLLGKLGTHYPRIPLAVKLLLGAALVTALELGTGLLVNRDFAVWDYRAQPGNFLGQICPMFAALWLPLSAAGMALYGWAETRLDRLGKCLRRA